MPSLKAAEEITRRNFDYKGRRSQPIILRRQRVARSRTATPPPTPARPWGPGVDLVLHRSGRGDQAELPGWDAILSIPTMIAMSRRPTFRPIRPDKEYNP